jgi:hypothetical protein
MDDRGRLNNLPAQASTFIGRDEVLAEVRALVARSRLVTLTGAGGTGKTRLARQLAAGLLDGTADGVWLLPGTREKPCACSGRRVTGSRWRSCSAASATLSCRRATWTLPGAADQLLADLGRPLEPLEGRLADLDRQRLLHAMGTAAFEAGYAAGRTLNLARVLELAADPASAAG